MSVVAGLVSTIIPVYNRPAMLREAVHSVLAQTHGAREVIIVDDGSTDDTLAAANALAGDHPREITVLQQRRKGPGLARERGLAVARGEFVQYLDSDDLLMPRKFELHLRGFARCPEAEVSYGGTRRYSKGQMPGSRMIRDTGTAFETLYPRVLAGRLWATSTPLYRRTLVERAGAWSALVADEDWLQDVRMACAGARLHFVDQHVCDMRDHEGPQLHRQPERLLERYRDMCRARHEMFRVLTRSGFSLHGCEYDRFRRSIFLLARQCGAVGLETESRSLVALLRIGHGEAGSRWQVTAYDAVARGLGFGTLGRVCARLDRLRDRFAGQIASAPGKGVSRFGGGIP